MIQMWNDFRARKKFIESMEKEGWEFKGKKK